MISSIDEHLAALYRLRRFGIKFGLATISRLMRGLGNPQNCYVCIHVAGTNGKGSVAAFLSSIFVHAGYKVGLYTSPHLVRFNERIQINGEPISDSDVARAAEAVRRIYTQGEPPTFFECATAMALYHFALKEVDCAILETGMGGRHDATNVVQPEVSVISNINMEHTEYLGNTLANIAAEKGGIIKAGAGVVTGVRQKEALRVIEKKAAEKGVPLRRLGKEIKLRKHRNGSFTWAGIKCRWPRVRVNLHGNHQIANAALALGVLELLMEKGIEVPNKAIYDGLASVHWPGRLEVVSKAPLILLDGAHNPAAVRALRRFLQNGHLEAPCAGEKLSRHTGKSGTAWQHAILIVGILKDKAWKPMLRELASIADRMILTKPDYERAADPDEMARFARSLLRDIIVESYLPDAISRALDGAGRDDLVCITGSLYTVGDARSYLEGLHASC